MTDLLTENLSLWPTATAVIYFLGILLYYRMSMAIIHAAVMLEYGEKEYSVDTNRLLLVSMLWPAVTVFTAVMNLFEVEENEDD